MLRRPVDEDIPNVLRKFGYFLSVHQHLMTSAQPHHIGTVPQHNGFDAGGALHSAVFVFDGHVVRAGGVEAILDEDVGTGALEVVVVAVEGVVMAVAADLAHTLKVRSSDRDDLIFDIFYYN